MAVIQTFNKISPAGLDMFPDTYEVGESAQNPDAILVRSASLHELEFGENLLAIARAGAGVNNIPIERCTQSGICVFNTPGANANAVKELVLTGLLLSSRKIPEALCWAATLQDGETTVQKQVEKGKSRFAGPEISGKTLGVIGLGAIGRLVANAAAALGMHVVGTDPFFNDAMKAQLVTSIQVVNSADEVYAVADYVTIHVPYNKDTEHMINASTIAKMKDGVRILNYARGELVCDEDILAAIASGKVSYYCTDFPNTKLVGLPHVIATPHLGASTPESEDNCAKMAATELIDYLERGDIKNSVNFPNVSLKATGKKLCVMHKNCPKAAGTIESAIAEAGATINAKATGVKGDNAYSLYDLSDAPTQMLETIAAHDGVYRVRVID